MNALLRIPVDCLTYSLRRPIVLMSPSGISYANIKGVSISGCSSLIARRLLTVFLASCLINSIARSVATCSCEISPAILEMSFASNVSRSAVVKRFQTPVMFLARSLTYLVMSFCDIKNSIRSRICSCARSIATVPSVRRRPCAMSET